MAQLSSKIYKQRRLKMIDLRSESERNAIGHVKRYIILPAILSLWRRSELRASVICAHVGRKKGGLL
jgi:hypothetical protein